VVVVAGVTVMGLPVPTATPPQEPEYQWITSPVPPPPPLRVSVALFPVQIMSEAGDVVIEVGVPEKGSTVTITLAHAE
jgi:hypothetical protein